MNLMAEQMAEFAGIPFADAEFADNSDMYCLHGAFGYEQDKCGPCIAEQAVREAQCMIHGHVLVDTSECGPDSGTMSIECTSCGVSSYSVLY